MYVSMHVYNSTIHACACLTQVTKMFKMKLLWMIIISKVQTSQNLNTTCVLHACSEKIKHTDLLHIHTYLAIYYVRVLLLERLN